MRQSQPCCTLVLKVHSASRLWLSRRTYVICIGPAIEISRALFRSYSGLTCNPMAEPYFYEALLDGKTEIRILTLTSLHPLKVDSRRFL